MAMVITREIAQKVRARINKESLRTRLERGWSIERALTTGATR